MTPTIGTLMGELLHKAYQANIFCPPGHDNEERKRVTKAMDDFQESFITGMLTRSKPAEEQAFNALKELFLNAPTYNIERTIHND